MSLHLGKDFLKSLHPHLLKSDKIYFNNCCTVIKPYYFRQTFWQYRHWGSSDSPQNCRSSYHLYPPVSSQGKVSNHLYVDGNLDVLDKGDIRVEHEGDIIIGETPLPVRIFPLWCVRLLVPTQGGVHQALHLQVRSIDWYFLGVFQCLKNKYDVLADLKLNTLFHNLFDFVARLPNLEVLVVQPLLLAIYPGTLSMGESTNMIVPEILTCWSLIGQGCAPPKVPLIPFLLKNMRIFWYSQLRILKTLWMFKKMEQDDRWNQILPGRILSSP